MKDIKTIIMALVLSQTVALKAVAGPILVQAGMLGGALVPSTDPIHKAVVKLRLIFPKGRGFVEQICSGTFISNSVVLTAAHCLIKPDGTWFIPERSKVELFGGLIPFLPRHTEKIITGKVLTEYISIPKSDKAMPIEAIRADLAAVVIKPLKDVVMMSMSPRQYANPESFMLAGYGVVDRDSGKLASTVMVGGLKQSEFPECANPLSFISNEENQWGQVIQIQRAGAAALGGDSGGPIFTIVGNDYFILGVTSTTNMKTTKDPSVVPQTCFARLDQHLDFINEVLRN